MNCPQCSQDMIQAVATNFGTPYWYCRGCKKELAELMVLEVAPVKTTYCAHVWAPNEDKCTGCGISGVEYLYPSSSSMLETLNELYKITIKT